jgi:hypothetical protein
VRAKVRAENLMTGEQENFPYQSGAGKRLPTHTTRVSNIDPIEVLHPATFQSMIPTNSKYAPAELDIDDAVSVAWQDEYLFLIPHHAESTVVKPVRKRRSQKKKDK